MQDEDILKQLGAKIKALRNAKGLTQAQLAHSINKDQQSIQRLERGGINPSFLYLVDIAKGLQIHLSLLLADLEA
jgi:putative transcriptional regulator